MLRATLVTSTYLTYFALVWIAFRSEFVASTSSGIARG